MTKSEHEIHLLKNLGFLPASALRRTTASPPANTRLATADSYATHPIPKNELLAIDSRIVLEAPLVEVISKGHIPIDEKDNWFCYITKECFHFCHTPHGTTLLQAYYIKTTYNKYIIYNIHANKTLKTFGISSAASYAFLLTYLIYSLHQGHYQKAWDAFLSSIDFDSLADNNKPYLTLYIAGQHHYDAPDYWQQLESGDFLLLEREPLNPYDANAIAIYVFKNEHKFLKLGYVPRHNNAFIAQLLDKGWHDVFDVELLKNDTQTFDGQLKINIYVCKNPDKFDIDEERQQDDFPPILF